MLGIIPHNFPFPEFTPKTRADVLHTCIKINNYFRSHDCIQVSVSVGTSDLHVFPRIRLQVPFRIFKHRAGMESNIAAFRLHGKKKCLPEPVQYTLNAEKEE